MAMTPLAIANSAQAMEPVIQQAINAAMLNVTPSLMKGAVGASRAGVRNLKKYLRRRTRSSGPSVAPKKNSKTPSAPRNASSGVFSARSASSHPISTKGRKGRKVKASLKKRIGKLESALKKKGTSTYKFCVVKPWSLSTEAQESRGTFSVRNKHSKIIYNLIGNWTSNTIDGKIGASIPKTDDNLQPKVVDGINTFRYVKRHIKYCIKNTGTMTANVKYLKYRAKQDTSQGALQQLQVILGDRLLPIGEWRDELPSLSTAGAEASFVSKRLIFNNDQGYPEVFQFLQELDDYKSIGKVGSTLLQPGDIFELYDTFNKTIASEQPERNTEVYGPEDTYGYFIQVTGVIATDNSNLDHVGRSDFEISAISYDYMTLRIDNSLGQKFYDWDVNAMNDSSNGWSTGSPSVTKNNDES